VCPTFPVPEGTGLLIAGGNRNIIRANFFYDNWRDGTKQFHVPPAARGEPDKPPDTYNGNRYLSNLMGVTPGGRDRVVSGRVRNASLRRVRIEARDVRLETADGARVEGTATFVGTFLHGLYPPTREPQRMAGSELRRTGRLAVIEPRTSVPVTLAWRLEEGEPPPERVDFGAGTLPLPR
jgi:hypothetical protein